MGAGNAIFEGWFKFAASEARNKFNITASADRGDIEELLGSDKGAINCQIFMRNKK